MHQMHPIVTQNLPEISRILRKNRVKRAYAFGSVCTDQFTDASDIDLLIAFDDAVDPVAYGQYYFTALEALETLLNRPVDLVTERSLQTPFLKQAIDRSRVVIYE